MVSKVKAKGKAAKAVKAPAIRKGRTSTSRISSKNQITIPVEILRSTGFGEGDEVEVKVSKDGKGIEIIKKELDLSSHPLAAIIGAGGDSYKNWSLEEERAYSWPE